MKDEIVNLFMSRGFLPSPEILEEIPDDALEENIGEINSKFLAKNRPIVMSKELFDIAVGKKSLTSIDWLEFEKAKVLQERGENGRVYDAFLGLLEREQGSGEVYGEGIQTAVAIKKENKVKVLDSYNDEPKKREVTDFVYLYRKRYLAIKEMLQMRPELKNTISIKRLLDRKQQAETTTIIGVVGNKKQTKNNNIMLTIEDTTGEIAAMIRNDKKELFEEAKSLVPDEVVGLQGVCGKGVFFVNNLFFPDVPLNKECKKCDEEVYAAFISDVHIGSNMFLQKEFERFLDWLNCRNGSSEQMKIAEKVRYLFIVGDLVDGCGIYPEQDLELVVKDIREQYKQVAEYIKGIRNDINIIICPGNHDALRISEPQPPLDKRYAQQLYDQPNVTLVCNPSFVNIHSSESFPGFDVLLYHGYSFDHIARNVDYIRENGGYERPDLILKFLLQKRHLAPTHASTLYIPEVKYDPLVIKRVPDFFVGGHIHKANVSMYRNVSTICCSCWQSKTAFQEKVGHNPEPARVPVVNLKTRETKILRFDA